MSAPEAVVRRVQEAITEHRPQYGDGWECSCGATLTLTNHNEHWLQAIADAAFAASLEWVADWLPAHTEGSKREGTARWPERDRDIYSAAIEDGQAWLRLLATETEATK